MGAEPLGEKTRGVVLRGRSYFGPKKNERGGTERLSLTQYLIPRLINILLVDAPLFNTYEFAELILIYLCLFRCFINLFTCIIVPHLLICMSFTIMNQSYSRN